MDERGIKSVLRDVLGRGTPLKTINGWVSLRCPLAPWRHEKGLDKNNSAGVKINNNGTSVYNCYACHSKFPLFAFVETLGRYTGDDHSEIVEELKEDHYLGAREIPPWGGYEDDEGDEEDKLVPLNEEMHCDLYDEIETHPYLEGRGISAGTIKTLGLLLDPEDQADGCERVLFPVRGPDGTLYGFSGRDTTGTARIKARDYFGLKKRLCILGSHLIDPKVHKYVLVVEGLFDYANGWENGHPTLALMHSTLTEAQRQILLEIGLPVYVLTDNDKAGRDCLKIIYEQLHEELPVLECPYPEVWIDDLDEEDGGHWLKDPGEMLKEDFDYAINNAEIACIRKQKRIQYNHEIR